MVDKKIFFNHSIVVYCPSFNKESGGTVVLHYLVDQLRSLNVNAYAAPIKKTYSKEIPWLIRKFKDWNFNVRKKFKTHPNMDVPIFNSKIKDEIVIYPEVIEGNPLGASHVVRWLLHKPGFFGLGGNYLKSDEIFYYAEFCRAGNTQIPLENQLRLTPMIQNDYFDFTGGKRNGSCRMIRKANISKNIELKYGGDSILLDGKTHAKISKIFRMTKYFFCHDPNTWFVYLAALSGCIPIVVPQSGLSSEDWRVSSGFKYGVAYGVEEIEWAVTTRKLLLNEVKQNQEYEKEHLVKFLNKLDRKFKSVC